MGIKPDASHIPDEHPNHYTMKALLSHRSLHPSDSYMTAPTAIYLLGETHKLIPYSTISHLGNPQHYMQYSGDLHKA